MCPADPGTWARKRLPRHRSHPLLCCLSVLRHIDCSGGVETWTSAVCRCHAATSFRSARVQKKKKVGEGAVVVAVAVLAVATAAPAPAVDLEASPVAPFVLLHRQRPSTVGRGARTRVRSEAGEGAGNSMLLFSNVSEADQAQRAIGSIAG